jgi:Ca-activated chloride channel homolog
MKKKFLFQALILIWGVYSISPIAAPEKPNGDEKANLPVFVAVLMDTSPSTRPKMAFSKKAAKDFVYSVTRLRKVKAANLTFDHEIKRRQDFTGSLDLLEKAIDGVRETGRQTSLYDAIYRFCSENPAGAKGRRVMVVITDGDDTFSRAALGAAIDIAQRTETVIYTVSTKSAILGSVPGVEAGQVKNKGDKSLERLAEATGGAAVFTGDTAASENAFAGIPAELIWLLTARIISNSTTAPRNPNNQ